MVGSAPVRSPTQVIPLAMLLLAACSSSSAPADEAAPDSVVADTTADGIASSQFTPEQETMTAPATETERSRLVAEFDAGIEALHARPTMITTSFDEESVRSTGTARIDRTRGLLDAVLETETNRGAITRRERVVEERYFLKSTTGPDAEAALNFTELPFEPGGAEAIDLVYTAYGRIGPTLDRWSTLLANVDFSFTTDESATRVVHHVQFDPSSIFDFFQEAGLERVGGAVPDEPTSIRFTLVDDVLVGIDAEGTHFHDGEALHVDATITYEPTTGFEVDVPPVDG